MFRSFLRRRPKIAYDPLLVPPLRLMLREGIDTLEEWFRWAEEWSMILRIFGGITPKSAVLEIGCGLGRIAFPLRYILSAEGSYNGFDVCKYKIAFLQRRFHSRHPNFHFLWADIHNTHYNPRGRVSPIEYRFPYPDRSFDIVYAASVFTHMLPNTTHRYFKEAARVTKSPGRCVFSFFLLDNYWPGHHRPFGFAQRDFDFDHQHADFGPDFAMVFPDDPERMTAYRLSWIKKLAAASGLAVTEKPVPGMWSGTTPSWITTQDLVVLEKR
jgi:SAM-dependent methyltransferase